METNKLKKVITKIITIGKISKSKKLPKKSLREVNAKTAAWLANVRQPKLESESDDKVQRNQWLDRQKSSTLLVNTITTSDSKNKAAVKLVMLSQKSTLSIRRETM